MNQPVTWYTVWLLLPEFLLVGLAVWTYVAGAFSDYRNGFNSVLLAGLGVCAYMLWQQDSLLRVWADAGNQVASFSGPLVIDCFGHAVRWLVLADLERAAYELGNGDPLTRVPGVTRLLESDGATLYHVAAEGEYVLE